MTYLRSTLRDKTVHLFQQVIFAICPPCTWLGGWLTFGVALCMIGLLTVVVGDLATIFGCLVGLRAEVTAITFVALGTSLPDLFASRNAALNEKHADAAVGNVTGSNSVNVFLGLGTPWVIACIYHTVNVRVLINNNNYAVKSLHLFKTEHTEIKFANCTVFVYTDNNSGTCCFKFTIIN